MTKFFKRIRGVMKIFLYWGICAGIGYLCGRTAGQAIRKILEEDNEDV